MGSNYNLKVTAKSATNLPNVEKNRDASDPYAIVSFKSSKFKTKVVKNENSPKWDETREFKVQELRATDTLDVIFKDSETFGFDRMLAQCKVSLKDCLFKDVVDIETTCSDTRNKILDGCSFRCQIAYDGPKTKIEVIADAEPDVDDESENIVTAENDEAGRMPDEGFFPTTKKASLRIQLPNRPMDYQIRVKIWEARQLKGSGIKPLVKVKIASQSKVTKVRRSNSPYWGEQFFFNFKMVPVNLFDEIIEFYVNSSNKFRSNAAIGSFKIDVGSVWDENNHIILKKWLLLTKEEDGSSEVKGYLKVSMMVLGAGDEAPPDHKVNGSCDDDIESNILMPVGCSMQPATFWCRLYRAVDLPRMDVRRLATMRNLFSIDETDERKQVDPFLIFEYVGKRVKSKVIYTENEPKWNQQLQLDFHYPSMCERIKFHLRDYDQLTRDEKIAVAELNLSAISATTEEDGFLPTFGPCWVNMYGAPREEGVSSMGSSNDYLNEGKGEGCAYRGRIFIELGMKLGAKPAQPILPIDDKQILAAEKFSKTRKYRVFAYFEEANMITDSVDDPIRFEVSIGNFGNSIDPTGVKMPSTTQPIRPVFDGQYYYYLPFGNNKPTIVLDCEFEDIGYRMGIFNMAKRLLTDVNPKVLKMRSLLSDQGDDEIDKELATYIINVLNVFKWYIPSLLRELKALENKGNALDKKLVNYQIKQLEIIHSTTEKEIENQTDFSNAIENIEKFVMTIDTLFSGAQCSIPDIIIWMLGSESRIAYVRIPVTKVFYHPKRYFQGSFCSKLHEVRLKFIGKKQRNYKIPAQIRLKMWFGLQKDENAWGSQHGEGNLLVVAETFEYEKYRPVVKWKSSDPQFADEFHQVALPKEEFIAPANWQFDGDWFVAVDKSMDTDPDEDLNERYDEVFESQTNFPDQEWHSAAVPWVTMYGEEAIGPNSRDPPSGWQYQGEWEPDMDRPVDENGWEYSFDIDTGSWSSSEKSFHTWRRRRWIRLRIKVKDFTELIKSYVEEDPENMGFEYGRAMCNSWHSFESKLDTRRRRRWYRNLIPANEDAQPVFFFQFKQNIAVEKPLINIAPRMFIRFKDPHNYQLRFYLYQARDLLSADDQGYSDPYCRVIALNRSTKSKIIMKTVNPTFNQTLIVNNLKYFNNPVMLADDPPLITVEVFDWDSVGTDDYLGRCDVRPLVKVDPANDHRVPQLEWIPVKKFDLPAGDILCSCELLLCKGDLPYEPPMDETRNVLVVPSNVAPKLQRTAVEILVWGLRDLQKYRLAKVDSPQVEFEIGEFKKSTCKVKNIKECPNFEECVVYFEMMLPIEEKYMPPMNIKIKDSRPFGRRPTVANHRLSTIANYRITPPKQLDSAGDRPTQYAVLQKRASKMGFYTEVDLTKWSAATTLEEEPSDISTTISEDREPLTKSSDEAPFLTKTKVMPETSKVMSRIQYQKEQQEYLSPGTDDTMDWWTKLHASLGDENYKEAKEYVHRGLDKIQILRSTLEKVDGMHMLKDFLQTFIVDEGKKEGDEDARYMGQFKGNLVLYKLPQDLNQPNPPRFFQNLPSISPEQVLLRIYIILGENLQPMDVSGKSDPFLIIRCGKQYINDKDRYMPNTINPMFGRMFEMTVSLPVEKDLIIQVWDFDSIKVNELIGETVIDLEDRFLSKHRALCGLPQKYNIKGLNKWRDCQSPKEILEWYTKRNNLGSPIWENSRTVVVDGTTYTLNMFEKTGPNEDNGPEAERLALHVLNQVNLVKEHIERRPLYSPSQPDIAQGSLYMWVDMFPKSFGEPGPAFNVTPRDPQKCELRIVVYNTENTELVDKSFAGEQMSDIYVKGWLEGCEHDIQETDVHYRSMDGDGMFNWRFVFQFEYNPALQRIVVKRKEHLWTIDKTEQYFPARINFQVCDNDVLSFDDVIGSLTLDLNGMFTPAKDAKHCSLEQLNKDAQTISLFKQKRLKGFWPVYRDDEKSPEGKVISSKLDLEIELVCGQEDIDAKPAGKARDQPNSNPKLEAPNRPATSFLWIMSPWKTVKYIIWKNYKWKITLTVIIFCIILFIMLIIYTAPGAFMNSLFTRVLNSNSEESSS